MNHLGEQKGVRYEVFTEEDMDGLVAVVTEAFTEHEPMSLAMKIPYGVFRDFMSLLAVKAAKERLTVIARDLETGMVVGALVNEDLMSEPADAPDPLDPKFNPIFTLLGGLTAYYKENRRFQAGECLHVFMIGVTQGFKGRNLSQHLIAYSMRNARRKGYKMVCTEATGNISQHIFGRKFGFRELKKVAYRTFVYDGDQVFNEIKDHWGAVLMERDLEDPVPELP